MVFADGVPHEHGVKGGHLVNSHPGHAYDFGHMMHGRYGQPSAILTLGQIQQWYHGCPFVAIGIYGEDGLGPGLVLGREFKWRGLIIFRSVPMHEQRVGFGRAGGGQGP